MYCHFQEHFYKQVVNMILVLFLLASPHRRFWNWLEYIFFFYNAIVGFATSIVRILLSIGVNLLLLFRLDTVILMKGWEFLDPGMSCIWTALPMPLASSLDTME